MTPAVSQAELNRTAPGCFGAASIYKATSEACIACVANEACGVKSEETLQVLRKYANVDDLLAQFKRDKIADLPVAIESQATPAVEEPKPIVLPERTTKLARPVFPILSDHDAMLAKMSVKAREQGTSLIKANALDGIRSDLQAGVNPFATRSPKYLRVACDMLINGGFTRASLKAALMDQLGWKDGSAGSHVSIVMSLMVSFGLVAENAGKFERVI